MSRTFENLKNTTSMIGRQIKRIKPKRLRPGDPIGIVAPASHFDSDLFSRGLTVLEGMGFRPVVTESLFERHGYFAGTDAHRAEQVNRLFADPEIKAVLCARGGFGAMRLLSLLDFERIRRNPKALVGFSDISALHAAINSTCGLVTFHGPTVTTLAKASKATRDSFYAAIAGEGVSDVRAEKGVLLKPGTASGPLAGGNLTTLCHLVGTPYQTSFSGSIALFEDVDEAPYRIDRMLAQMKMAGSFDGIAGIALGSFRRCGRIESIYEVFSDAFKEDAIPILAGFPFGHHRKNLTVPLGVAVTLDADRKMLRFDEPATRI